MKYKCAHCGVLNNIPRTESRANLLCTSCSKTLLNATEASGETSAAVGMIGGAALGASLGGPVGAIIGGILGGILGKESKGVG